MEVNEDLINKFFNNACTADEAIAVSTFLLKNKNELDKYLKKSEWDTISSTQYMDTELSRKTLILLKQRLFKNTAAKRIKISKRQVSFVAAAAVLIALAGTLLYQIQTSYTTSGIQEFSKTATPKNKHEATARNNWQVKFNSSKKPVSIALQDGSVITLYKGSKVEYSQPFENGKREIKLNGAALFNVAKNKLQPFIVYSGNISTTALGTSFVVTANNYGKDSINIKLFTGKVVVRSVVHTAGWKNDIYLSPNEQVTYNSLTEAAVVGVISNAHGHNAKIEKATDNNTELSKNELKFNRASLPQVMKDLSELYNVTISYTNADIAEINFTGVINKADKIESILNLIAQMNNLKITVSTDGFILSKN